MDDKPAFVDTEGAAARIGGGITASAVRYWRTNGGGPPHTRVGKRVLYPVDLLDQFIQQLRDAAAAGA
jgi:hypothetical protein